MRNVKNPWKIRHLIDCQTRDHSESETVREDLAFFGLPMRSLTSFWRRNLNCSHRPPCPHCPLFSLPSTPLSQRLSTLQPHHQQHLPRRCVAKTRQLCQRVPAGGRLRQTRLLRKFHEVMRVFSRICLSSSLSFHHSRTDAQFLQGGMYMWCLHWEGGSTKSRQIKGCCLNFIVYISCPMRTRRGEGQQSQNIADIICTCPPSMQHVQHISRSSA